MKTPFITLSSNIKHKINKQLHSRHSTSRSGQPHRNRDTNDIAMVIEIVGSRWSIDLTNSHKPQQTSGWWVSAHKQTGFTANQNTMILFHWAYEVGYQKYSKCDTISLNPLDLIWTAIKPPFLLVKPTRVDMLSHRTWIPCHRNVELQYRLTRVLICKVIKPSILSQRT